MDEKALPVRKVEVGAPLRWLQRGWNDFQYDSLSSIGFGVVFAIGGGLIVLATLDAPHLMAAAFSGFFLLAPLLASGLYALSMLRGAVERPAFFAAIALVKRKKAALAQIGLVLLLVMLLWERFTAVLFAVLASPETVNPSVATLIRAGEEWELVALWFISGALVAAGVFTVTVVSVPLLFDRDVDLFTAVATSVQAVRTNPLPMLVWAGAIVLLTLVGYALLLFGLAVTLPLLGHATWHAYCDLVGCRRGEPSHQ
jgi:uncharacterized membrane protein